MLPTMNEKDHATPNPVVVIQTPKETKKMSSTKKYVIMGVISIILLGLLLTGILVGMHIFTQAQQELVQFTLKLGEGRSQEVKSDITNNLVTNHVTDKEHEAWIVSGFNKNIKTTKILQQGFVNCFLTPLNRSNSMEPSAISIPDQTDNITPKDYTPVTYQISGEPITDITFLSKEARDLCKGVSTYWMYPTCSEGSSNGNNTKSLGKRAAPYFVFTRKYYNGLYYPCYNGCCKTVCACQIMYTWLYSGNRMYCNWITWRCCPGTNNCLYQSYCELTPQLICTNGVC